MSFTLVLNPYFGVTTSTQQYRRKQVKNIHIIDGAHRLTALKK